MKNCRLFIGNPGVGKSTLVNCLAQKVLFKNGVSYGGGMTYQMDKVTYDGITYMDTPGLADIKLREAAAKAITEALKQDGQYQIFFVVTLESGRVRPQDLATIKLVLENAKDITAYNLIINKLTKQLYGDLQKDNQKKLRELVAELNFGQEDSVKPPNMLLLLRHDDLDDNDNSFVNFDELEDFVRNAPYVVVNPVNVNDIPGDDSFDKAVALLESQLSELRKDNELMKKQLEDTERKYREMEKQNNSPFNLLDVIPIYGSPLKALFKKIKRNYG